MQRGPAKQVKNIGELAELYSLASAFWDRISLNPISRVLMTIPKHGEKSGDCRGKIGSNNGYNYKKMSGSWSETHINATN